VEVVTSNENAVDFNCDDGRLQFHLRLFPKQAARVCVMYVESQKVGEKSENTSVGYKLRTCFRRYLSEFRDNYVSRSHFLSTNAARIREYFKE
jgi:hypothetical protein